MIFPCIDLMDGKVVQLVQGREKALEGDSPDEMLRKFAAFPEIQVIDLDAAMGRGSNDDLVRMLASQAAHAASAAACAPSERAQRAGRTGRAQGDRRHRGFTKTGINERLLAELRDAIGRERLIVALDSKGGRIVVKGWQEATDFTAEECSRALEPYCSRLPLHLCRQGRHDAGHRPRLVPPPARRDLARNHRRRRHHHSRRRPARCSRWTSTPRWAWRSTPAA